MVRRFFERLVIWLGYILLSTGALAMDSVSNAPTMTDSQATSVQMLSPLQLDESYIEPPASHGIQELEGEGWVVCELGPCSEEQIAQDSAVDLNPEVPPYPLLSLPQSAPNPDQGVASLSCPGADQDRIPSLFVPLRRKKTLFDLPIGDERSEGDQRLRTIQSELQSFADKEPHGTSTSTSRLPWAMRLVDYLWRDYEMRGKAARDRLFASHPDLVAHRKMVETAVGIVKQHSGEVESYLRLGMECQDGLLLAMLRTKWIRVNQSNLASWQRIAERTGSMEVLQHLNDLDLVPGKRSVSQQIAVWLRKFTS